MTDESRDNYDAMDRRPIASRERKIFQRIASGLARRGVSANAISIAGMICGIAGGAALFGTSAFGSGFALWIAAAALIQLRLLANMLDGMVAIESGTASPVGELYNDVPDRIADVAVLVGAGYAVGGDVTLGWAAACVALFVTYARLVGKTVGAASDFCGPMAKPHRMFAITVTALYCGLAPDTWQPAWGARGLPALVLAIIVVLGLLTAMRRLLHAGATLRREAS